MLNGQDINLKLKLRNKDRTNKAMSIRINAQTMMYNGKPANNIQSIVQEKTLLPGQGQQLVLQVFMLSTPGDGSSHHVLNRIGILPVSQM